MARIRCNHCGKKFPADYTNCPYCGLTNIPRRNSGESEKSALTGKDNSSLLSTCPDCGHSVSRRAISCPQCGAPLAAGPSPYRKPDWGIEWKSQASIGSWPLIHVAIGRKNGRLMVARGVIAIGQFGIGLITIAQFGVGLLFGFGQFVLGLTVVAQFAIGLIFALGQFAVGYVAIGQFAAGYYILCQIGFGEFVWSMARKDPEAVAFFQQLASQIGIR